MKLLFDQNISYNLVEEFKDIFPGSNHVRLIGLDRADDLTIWKYAEENDFTIVTFDSDFYERLLLDGFPPKVVWLRCGNSSTDYLRELIKHHQSRILDFEKDAETGCLEIA